MKASYLNTNFKIHNDLYVDRVSQDSIMLRQMNFVQSSNKLTKLAVKSAVSQPKA